MPPQEAKLLLQLPTEVLVEALAQVQDAKALLYAAATCKTLHSLVDRPDLDARCATAPCRRALYKHALGCCVKGQSPSKLPAARAACQQYSSHALQQPCLSGSVLRLGLSRTSGAAAVTAGLSARNICFHRIWQPALPDFCRSAGLDHSQQHPEASPADATASHNEVMAARSYRQLACSVQEYLQSEGRPLADADGMAAEEQLQRATTLWNTGAQPRRACL